MQLHTKFIEIAKQFSKKIAVHDEATGNKYTYERLLIGSLLLSKRIHKFKGQYLGILLPTSAGAMISILATLMSGKTPVMLNYSTGATENCLYAQEKCSFTKIITSKKLIEKLNLKPLDCMIYIEDILNSLTKLNKISAAIKSKFSTNIIKSFIYSGNENDTAVILFTSGSEKEPKAVQLSHKNIFHNIINVQKIFDISPNFIFMANLPFFHVFGLTVDFWLPILVGATIVTYPNPLDYRKVSKLVKKHQVSIIVGTPSFFYGYERKSDPGDFASVKIAVAGADKLTPHIYNRFLEKHNLKLLEGYGTTETSPVISVNTLEDRKLGSVGKPIPGVEVKIVDNNTDMQLPPNKTGKILVRGDLVMKGYLGDYEETSLRIHNGWYDTGDMGLLDEDGFLWHKGRLKRFVKIGGEMVSLVKVESVLEKYIPEDEVCCVVDIPNLRKGAEIVAALTTGKIKKRKIIRKMSKELPSIALPRQFIMLEELPMMPSGKVNFRKVKEICKKELNN